MREAIDPLPNTPSWRGGLLRIGQGQFQATFFNLVMHGQLILMSYITELRNSYVIPISFLSRYVKLWNI
jgi:hypothetical protein